MSKRRTSLLLGYVGKGNFGDELMVEAIRDAVGPENCEIIGGRIALAPLLRKLLRANQLIVCGGGVISSRTGSYQRVLVLAKLLGVRRIFFSIEASGWPRGRAGLLQRWIMRGAKVSTRTLESRAIILQQLPAADVTDVIDAFYLHRAFAPEGDDSGQPARLGRFVFVPRSDQKESASRIVVLPRAFPDEAGYSNAMNIARIMQVVGELDAPSGGTPVLVSPSADIDVIDDYVEALEKAGHCPIVAASDEQIDLTPETHVVSNRLHIGKACAFFAIPNTLVSYDRKTELPQLLGETGRIVRMSGETVNMHDLSMSTKGFAMRRAMSLGVLNEALSR